MATTLAGSVGISLTFDYLKTATGFDTLSGLLRYVNSPAPYTSGSGANQVNAIFLSLARSLAATSESFDLNTQTDVYGATINFATVKLLFIRNKSTTAGQYLRLSGNFLDGDVSNLGPLGGTSPVAYIGPGGEFLWNSPTDGATVTNTTADTITLTNAATFTYDIVIAGVLV